MPVKLTQNDTKITAQSETAKSPKAPIDPTFEIDGNSGYLEGCVRGVRSAKELMALMKIDPTEWAIDRQKIGMHEMGFKKETVSSANLVGEAQTKEFTKVSTAGVQPLYSIQVWLKRKVHEKILRAVFNDMFEQFKQLTPLIQPVPEEREGLLFEVDIFDHHFGKLCWAAETGSTYDVKTATLAYAEALEGLLKRAEGFKIGRVLLPLGNDVFHVDNGRNMTTGGTPQDVDGKWQRAFVEGRKAMARAIMRLRMLAPVDVLMISGNHDEEKVFYLGEVLAATFGNTQGVTVDNTPRMRKYYHWNQVLIGFTHGNLEKHLTLPLIMATEQKEAWAKSKFREFHCGHRHTTKDLTFVPVEEFNSVRVRTLASLTPPDGWHKKMGYEGLRSTTAHVWDKDEGLVATLSYQIKH